MAEKIKEQVSRKNLSERRSLRPENVYHDQERKYLRFLPFLKATHDNTHDLRESGRRYGLLEVRDPRLLSPTTLMSVPELQFSTKARRAKYFHPYRVKDRKETMSAVCRLLGIGGVGSL